MRISLHISILLLGLYLLACKSQFIIPESPFPISDIALRIDTLATGFEIPYGLEILGDDEYLITDRKGKLFHYQNGEIDEIKRMPQSLNFQDPGIPLILHGGLMDVKVHPNYPGNPWIYVTHLSLENKTVVRRFKLDGKRAVEMEKIFETGSSHFVGNNARLVWQDSAHFFLNIGGSALSTVSDPIWISQQQDEDWGKIHRLHDDGSIPRDNPILPGAGTPGSIWSYGHRDACGLFYEKSSQTLFSVEHGPKGGDEFNIIQKGENYGWPLFSFGIDYSGAEVSLLSRDSASKISMLPLHHWTVPSPDGGQAIAPGFLWKVSAGNIPEWNGKFLLSSLFYRRALLFDLTTMETTGLPITGRVRFMCQLPEGDFLVLIERTRVKAKNGVLVRISNP